MGGGETCAALPVAARGDLRGAGLAGTSVVPVRFRLDFAMSASRPSWQGILPGGEADIERLPRCHQFGRGGTPATAELGFTDNITDL